MTPWDVLAWLGIALALLSVLAVVRWSVLDYLRGPRWRCAACKAVSPARLWHPEDRCPSCGAYDTQEPRS